MVQKCQSLDSGGRQYSCHSCPQWPAALLALVLLWLAVILVVCRIFLWLRDFGWFEDVPVTQAEVV